MSRDFPLPIEPSALQAARRSPPMGDGILAVPIRAGFASDLVRQSANTPDVLALVTAHGAADGRARHTKGAISTAPVRGRGLRAQARALPAFRYTPVHSMVSSDDSPRGSTPAAFVPAPRTAWPATLNGWAAVAGAEYGWAPSRPRCWGNTIA